MIYFEIDKNTEQQIYRKLSDLKNGTPVILKIAINNTAKEARNLLFERAQKAYTVKKGRFNKAATIKRANAYNLTAVINIKGSTLELKDFKTSPATPPKQNIPGRHTKAKVKSSNPMKNLEIAGIKAFIVKFANGHVSVAQRRSRKRLPIKTLFSTSIPKMIGDEKEVYGVVEPRITTIYNNEVQKALEKYIAKNVR